MLSVYFLQNQGQRMVMQKHLTTRSVRINVAIVNICTEMQNANF